MKTAVKRHKWYAVSCVALLCLSGCALEREQSDEPETLVSSNHPALISLGGSTTLVEGSPSPRQATCPKQALPDRCGSWDGIELSARRTYGNGNNPGPGNQPLDQHCFCRPIDFSIPAILPVTHGSSGPHKANLSFRRPSGTVVTCQYRGDPPPQQPPGSGYFFTSCSDGSLSGQSATSDWFSLEIELGDHRAGTTEVQLRLGEPDVVAGTVQEEVFYSTDSSIPNAALYVPRGAAPSFQRFDLSVLSQVPTGTTIPNGGDSFVTSGPALDVHATGLTDFAFTPVDGAQCPRIELPYDPAALSRLGIVNGERSLHARQIVDLSGVLGSSTSLASAGPVTIDLTRHTITFCVAHLSFYVGGVNQDDADLTRAQLQQNGVTIIDFLTASSLQPIRPSSDYTLVLEFKHGQLGKDWVTTSTTGADLVRLESVLLQANGKVVSAPSGWNPSGPGTAIISSAFTNIANGTGRVTTTQVARFSLPIRSPAQTEVLNLCLNDVTQLKYFGECFSWDRGHDAGGTALPPFTEICDGIDNDRDGLPADEDFRPPLGQSCSLGTGACKRSGSMVCSADHNSTTCNAQPGTPTTETCNEIDDDCNGSTDETFANKGQTCAAGIGACQRSGAFVCKTDGSDTTCNAQPGAPIPEVCDGIDQNCNGVVDEGTTNECGGCGALSPPPGTGCMNGQLGECARSGQFACTSPTSTACNAPFVPPQPEVCNGVDSNCDGHVCHTIQFRAANVDDEVRVRRGPGEICPLPPEGLLLPPDIFACTGSGQASCTLTRSTESYGLTDDGRSMFTLSLYNGGCFNTHGDFFISVDGVETLLSSQQDVGPFVHCGVTHQQTFLVDFDNGTVEPLPAKSCEFDCGWLDDDHRFKTCQ